MPDRDHYRLHGLESMTCAREGLADIVLMTGRKPDTYLP